MAIAWTPENDRKLLLAFIAICKEKIDFAEAAKQVGQGCTERAVVERVKKLKKQVALSADGGVSLLIHEVGKSC